MSGTGIERVAAAVVLAMWCGATGLLWWRHKKWQLSGADTVTLSLLILFGLTFLRLALHW